MTTAVKKVAISIPIVTYRALERARARLGQSRSESIANAVEDWLRGLDADESRRRYIEGYLRLPESSGPAEEALAVLSTAGWSTWEPGESSRVAESGRALPAQGKGGQGHRRTKTTMVVQPRPMSKRTRSR